MNIKLTIEYDGTDFRGWQIQGKKRTVQHEITKTLEKIFSQKIKLIGSGRTDSGVHAKGQVANFKADTKLAPKNIQKALNSNLPDDIVIRKVEKALEDFHAQYSAKSKTYRYTILNRDHHSAMERNHCLYYPKAIDVNFMKKGGISLLGRKNFKSFQAYDPRKPSRSEDTMRTIRRLDIKKSRGFITIDIEATGFLYKMVRNIVGTLLEVGNGSRTVTSVKATLQKKDRKRAGPTAKPHGLCLTQVKY